MHSPVRHFGTYFIDLHPSSVPGFPCRLIPLLDKVTKLSNRESNPLKDMIDLVPRIANPDQQFSRR